jgi:hypothetical protein
MPTYGGDGILHILRNELGLLHIECLAHELLALLFVHFLLLQASGQCGIGISFSVVVITEQGHNTEELVVSVHFEQDPGVCGSFGRVFHATPHRAS